MNHRFFILISALLSLFCAPTFASTNALDPARQLTLDSVHKAYSQVDEDLAAAKARGEAITEVVIEHYGQENPPELAALMERFHAENIKVTFTAVSREQVDKLVAIASSTRDADAIEAMRLIRYHATKPADSDEQARLTFRQKRAELWATIRHTLGTPKGVTLMAYKINRTINERAVELTSATVRTLLASVVAYQTLTWKNLETHNLNVPLGVATTAAFTFAFAYWERGGRAFKGQGITYDFSNRNFISSRSCFLLFAFIDSVIMRQSIMIASHLTDHGFTATWDMATAALVTSAVGLIGKGPMEMWIKSLGVKHGKWHEIAVGTAWGLFYSSFLQLAAQFQLSRIAGYDVGDLFRLTLGTFGGAGLIYELFVRNPGQSKEVATRIMNWARGIETRSTCQTILTVKTTKLTPSEAKQ